MLILRGSATGCQSRVLVQYIRDSGLLCVKRPGDTNELGRCLVVEGLMEPDVVIGPYPIP